MNRWLDSKFPQYPENFVEIQQRAFRGVQNGDNFFAAERQRMMGFAEEVFAEREVMHDHAGVAMYVPKECFKFTVLRDPESRIKSHLRDYQRLAVNTHRSFPPGVEKMMQATITLSPKDFLQIYADPNQAHGEFFDNYLTRILARNLIGTAAIRIEDVAQLVPVALDALHHLFDFVGILEEVDTTNTLLAQRLGWAPEVAAPHSNRTEVDPDEAEAWRAASAQMAAATRYDWVIYREAQALFEQARREASPYDRTNFEAIHLAQRLALLQPDRAYGAKGAYFGVDQPIVGTGHQGRAMSNKWPLTVSTRKEVPFVLYLPVPKGQKITLYLEMCHDRFPPVPRIRRHFEVDGAAVRPRLVRRKNRLEFKVKTTNAGWARVDFDVPSADVTKGQPLLLTGYGWEPA